jgi:hypothetical protein
VLGVFGRCVNLHVAYFNFCGPSGEMRVMRAQAAGLTDHCRTFDELLAGQVAMIEYAARKLAGFIMRFTIRDLLWLTALIALGAGWWADRTHLARVYADMTSLNAEKRAKDEQYINHMMIRLNFALKREGYSANWNGTEWKLTRLDQSSQSVSQTTEHKAD